MAGPAALALAAPCASVALRAAGSRLRSLAVRWPPAIDATAGVTLGGAGVDEFGRWPPPMNEQVPLTNYEIIVDVPADSAALASLRM
jgi:hypothetical protein